MTYLRDLAAKRREARENRELVDRWADFYATCLTADQLDALADVVEAARELADDADGIAIYPEGAFGVEEMRASVTLVFAALSRFDDAAPNAVQTDNQAAP